MAHLLGRVPYDTDAPEPCVTKLSPPVLLVANGRGSAEFKRDSVSVCNLTQVLTDRVAVLVATQRNRWCFVPNGSGSPLFTGMEEIAERSGVNQVRCASTST